jgi:hypothetical protein
MVVYAIYISHITYNLEPFGEVKTPILLIPWHVHEQNLNGEKHNALSYICYSFISRWLFKNLKNHNAFIIYWHIWWMPFKNSHHLLIIFSEMISLSSKVIKSFQIPKNNFICESPLQKKLKHAKLYLWLQLLKTLMCFV